MTAKPIRLTHKIATTSPSGRELHHLQFSLQAASRKYFGYTLVEQRRGIVKKQNLKKSSVIVFLQNYQTNLEQHIRRMENYSIKKPRDNVTQHKILGRGGVEKRSLGRPLERWHES
jgi:hypothetical protein